MERWWILLEMNAVESFPYLIHPWVLPLFLFELFVAQEPFRMQYALGDWWLGVGVMHGLFYYSSGGLCVIFFFLNFTPSHHTHTHSFIFFYIKKWGHTCFLIWKIAFFALQFDMNIHIRIFKYTVFILQAVLFHCTVMDSCTQWFPYYWTCRLLPIFHSINSGAVNVLVYVIFVHLYQYFYTMDSLKYNSRSKRVCFQNCNCCCKINTPPQRKTFTPKGMGSNLNSAAS